MLLYSLKTPSVCLSVPLSQPVAVFPEWNAQVAVFVALDDLERQTSSRALQKTEVKGCGEALSTDKLHQ
jgi:hypothetical protein